MGIAIVFGFGFGVFMGYQIFLIRRNRTMSDIKVDKKDPAYSRYTFISGSRRR